MQSYVECPESPESQEMTEWKTSGDDESEGWKIADQQISREIHMEETDSGRFPALTHEDTLALEAMAANRLKPNKPEPIGEYRKPSFKSSLSASLPDFGTVLKYSMLASIAIGLAIAFFLGLSGPKLGTASKVAHNPEPKPARVVAPRHPRAVQYAAVNRGSSSGSASSAKVTGVKPVVDDTPLPEYKGPSSVTGASVPHRHAYQTTLVPGGAEN